MRALLPILLLSLIYEKEERALRMRKIMVVQHCGEIGGSGIGLLAVLNMLKNRFDVVAYCAGVPDHLCRYYDARGFLVKTFKNIPSILYHSGGPSMIDAGFLIPLLKLRKAKREWEQIIHDEKPDIVLVNSMILSWMWEPIKACGAMAICHVREVMPNRRDPRGKLILRNLEHFDAVWFISEHEKSYFNLKKPETAIIRDSLTDQIPTKNEVLTNQDTNDEFHALYVGGLSKLKGIVTLLKALQFLDKRVTLHIAGYIPESVKFVWIRHEKYSLIKNAFMIMNTGKLREMRNMLRGCL